MRIVHRAAPAALAFTLSFALVACGGDDDGAGAGGSSDLRRAGFVDSLQVVSTTDAFGGESFGAVGPYQVVTGIVTGKLNPAHPANAGIVDLELAPRDADGLVSYTTDVVILRPKNAAAATGLLFYDVVNRGNKIALSFFNAGGPGFAAGQAGNGLLMRQGYTVVWSGWQGDVPQTGRGDAQPIGTKFPLAKNADGSPITGASREEAVFDNTTNPATIRLTYEPATTDKAQVVFNGRQTWATPAGMTWDSPSVPVPAADWEYVTDPATGRTTVRFTRPAGVDAGAIWSFVYPAKDPLVMGVGLAAVRDLVSFLRFDGSDARGNPNPVADIRHTQAVIEGVSQSGRFVRDFVWQGFNDDARGNKVFDGAIPVIPGSRKTFTNFRWGQPGRWSKQHTDHFQPGDQFPFAYPTITDPLTGQADGILRRCQASGTCPRVIHVDGGYEVWGARGGLLVTDGAGRDIANPETVRLYVVPGANHGGAGGVGTQTTPVQCVNASSAVAMTGPLKASVVLMEDWLRRGVAPPPSNYGSIAGGTLSPSFARTQVGFPDLAPAGIAYPAVANELWVTDYARAIPARDLSRKYVVPVPRTDADGNETNGIRVPDVAVPLATYTSWNIRKAGFAAGDLCDSVGSTLPFAKTLAARQASGDPRPSSAERYASKADYVARVRAQAQALVDQRLLLPEDVATYVGRAEAQTLFP